MQRANAGPWNDLQVGSIITVGVGAVLLMKGTHPAWSFFVGGVAVYWSTIVLEGVSMSLVSKVIPGPSSSNGRSPSILQFSLWLGMTQKQVSLVAPLCVLLRGFFQTEI